MNNLVFRKTMGSVTKHRDVKLVTTEKIKSYLVSKPNYHKFFLKKLNSNRNEKYTNIYDIYIYEDIVKKVWCFKSRVRKTATKRKKQKSYCSNERWIRWKNHEKICGIERKNIQIFNRWQRWKLKSKRYKKRVTKRKLKFEWNWNCLQPSRFENKIN